MGRSPCCDKVGLKKGPWTPEEDQKLLAYIEEHGHGSWRALPSKAGLQRCGKSCRLRWTNYLRPDIKRGKFTTQEEQTIIQLHALLGNRWSAIATHLAKRTDNEIKNYWNTHLKKRLTKMGIDPVTHKSKNDALIPSDGAGSKNAANLSHMAQWESARLEAEARLVRQSKLQFSDSSTHLFQAQSSEFGSGSTGQLKPDGASMCLDVLKAWTGGAWTKATEVRRVISGGRIGGGGGELESPTSTLTSGVGESSSAAFAEFVASSAGSSDGGGTTKEEGEENEWKDLPEYRDEIENSSFTFASANSSEHVPSVNFVEKFTDLLLSSYSGDRQFSDEDGGGGVSSVTDYCEDNKNYWNSILNLVNSSPSDSPLF